MAKKGRAGNGYAGLFGRRKGATIWISGNVTAPGFAEARARLASMYRSVYGRPAKRITKTDVVEYLLMGTALAHTRLCELKDGKG